MIEVSEFLGDASLQDVDGGLVMAGFEVCASVLCVGAEAPVGRGRRRRMTVWRLLAVALLLLAINSLTRGDALVLDWLRGAARDGGWYEYRRELQFGTLALLLAMGVFGARRVQAYWRRSALPPLAKQAVGGTMALWVVLVLRAVSFHYTDYLVDWDLGGVRLGQVCELLGLLAIAQAGFRQMWANRDH